MVRNGFVTTLAVVGEIILAPLALALPLSIILALVGGSPFFVLALLAVAAMDTLPVAALAAALLLLASILARSHRVPILLGLLIAASSVARMGPDQVISPTAWSSGATLVVVYWVGIVLAAASGLSLVVVLLRKGRTHRSVTRGEQAPQPDAPEVGAQ